MFVVYCWVDGQWYVDEQFVEEEVVVGFVVEYQCVFVDLVEVGLFGDGFFQYWCVVDEGVEIEWVDFGLDVFGQLLQMFVDQFVVVVVEGVV